MLRLTQRRKGAEKNKCVGAKALSNAACAARQPARVTSLAVNLQKRAALLRRDFKYGGFSAVDLKSGRRLAAVTSNTRDS